MQSRLCAVVLRVQLCNQAVQASLKLSLATPGRSLQAAKIHLLFGLTKLGVLVLGAETLGVGGATAGASSRGGVGLTGREPQATKNRDREINKLPKMYEPRSFFMGLILLEALLALVLLLLIVWWTMFSGRKKGELITKEDVKSNKQNDVEGS